MDEILTDILWDSISYFDYGEEYYHGMLNGIFTGRGYAVESNAESGLGRLDLRVKDRKNRRMILMEFKRSTKEEHLERDCEDALEQIKNNGYARKMPMGYRKQIVCGIAFFGKVAKIRLLVLRKIKLQLAAFYRLIIICECSIDFLYSVISGEAVTAGSYFLRNSVYMNSYFSPLNIPAHMLGKL